MSDTDWVRIGMGAGVSLLSAVGGAFVAVWRWGRQGALDEQKVKDDYDAKIAELRDEVRKDMSAHAQKIDEGNDLLVAQFKETLDGIRRQHDDHKLDVEKRFLLKDDFRDFREEYREDMRDLKKSIADIARSQ